MATVSDVIDRLKVYMIYFLFAVFFYSHSVGLILVILFFLWALGESLYRKRYLIDTSAHVIALLIFIGWCLLTSTVFAEGNLKRIGKFIYYLPLLLSAWFVLTDRDIKKISVISVVAMIVGVPLAIAQVDKFSIYTIGNFPILGHHIPLAHHLSTLCL